MNAFGSTPTNPPFPTRYPTRAPLVLPRRNRAAVASGWADALSPDSGGRDREADRLAAHLQAALEERERAVAEAETRLAERTRDLDELEALLRAREALLDSARLRDAGAQHGVVTLREAEALHQLRDELERQETSLREARQAMKEREKYLEESETRLFEKVQEQQVKESELEQREEDVCTREARLNGGAASPAKAAFDEFRE
jgi:chromosome segregation ATPase